MADEDPSNDDPIPEVPVINLSKRVHSRFGEVQELVVRRLPLPVRAARRDGQMAGADLFQHRAATGPPGFPESHSELLLIEDRPAGVPRQRRTEHFAEDTHMHSVGHQRALKRHHRTAHRIKN